MHVTTSPTYPQSNGKVEAAVNSAKTVMSKSRKTKSDPYLALLEYRNRPRQGLGTSPVQLPIVLQLLKPNVQLGTYQKLLANKERQAITYNTGHGCQGPGSTQEWG